MKKDKKQSPQIPLVHALAWIVSSALLIAGSAHIGLQYYLKEHVAGQAAPLIRTLIQTGPHKEALKTEYLAQLLEISADRPPVASEFDLKKATQKLRASPLIADAHIKLIKPDTIYVDYTIRKPIAWLMDYDNVAVDRSFYPFPFRPFFSPKNLPEIYMGLGRFGESCEKQLIASWNKPLEGKYVDLALTILTFLTDVKMQELFELKRIDLSSAYAESYGTREIVVIVEDRLMVQKEGKDIQYIFPRMLRLSTKNYAAQLGNYLKLREKLMQEQMHSLILAGFSLPQVHNYRCVTPQVIQMPPAVLDLRIPNLAFLQTAS